MPADPWADEPGYRTIHYAEFTEEVFRVPRVMVWLGTISYGVYLWHFAILVSGHAALGWLPSPIELGLLAGVSVLFGWASWRLVEKPALRYRPQLTETLRFARRGRVALGDGQLAPESD